MSKTVESNAESSNSPVTSTNEKSGLQGDDALLVEKIFNAFECNNCEATYSDKF